MSGASCLIPMMRMQGVTEDLTLPANYGDEPCEEYGNSIVGPLLAYRELSSRSQER